MTSVLEYLRQSAERFPEKVALSNGETALSYKSYLSLSQKVGAYVAQKEADCRAVGVWALRSIYTPVLFFGAVWGGCCYVPLDPGLPAAKLQKILCDCKLDLILTPEETALPEGVTFAGKVVSLEKALAEGEALPCPTVGTDPAQPLYMVYTSGSTGKPKGVLKSHRAMMSFLEAYQNTFSFSADEVIGNQTPFCFDASAKDVYLALALGARLEILATELFSFPVRLIEAMNRRRITMISWVPSALSIVTQLNTFSEILPTTLQKVFFVGEVFPMKQLNRWRKALPNLQYVNLYGSSELAGICCYYQVQGEFADTDALPMGVPLENCRVYLIQDGKPIAQPGQIGELYVSSPALADCYYNDPEKNAASFLETEQGRVFRTGDLAQYTPEGLLVFAARKDYQIKHMGHRIELGEIEAAAAALEEVANCCCLYHREKSKIVLFCQPASQTVTGQEIRRKLRGLLSDYMAPNQVRLLPQLPLNPNGKIDRPALQQMLEKKQTFGGTKNG